MIMLNDLLLVKLDAKETKTKGGLIKPDKAQNDPQTGEIIHVTDGSKLKPGMRIAFPFHCPMEWKDDLVIIHEKDIFGIVD